MAKDDIALTGDTTAMPAGCPPIDLKVEYVLLDVPRDPRKVRENILASAGQVIGRVVDAAKLELERRFAVSGPPDPDNLPWQKMQPGVLDPVKLDKIAAAAGVTPEELAAAAGEMWVNDRYQVAVRDLGAAPGRPPMYHLSIRRNDRGACRDWRDMQRIKNDIVGAECEGVEVYPAESRLVDEANQFHLWVIKPPGVGFPFGFKDRRVSTGTGHEHLDVGQRQWFPTDEPADLLPAGDLGNLGRMREVEAAPPVEGVENPPAQADVDDGWKGTSRIVQRYQRVLLKVFSLLGADMRESVTHDPAAPLPPALAGCKMFEHDPDDPSAQEWEEVRRTLFEAQACAIPDDEFDAAMRQVCEHIMGQAAARAEAEAVGFRPPAPEPPLVVPEATGPFDPDSRARVPFTPEQVKSFNDFQRHGAVFHPFTCDGDRSDEAHRLAALEHNLHDPGMLIAKADGSCLYCPACGYTQGWCHGMMADGSWRDVQARMEEALPPALRRG